MASVQIPNEMINDHNRLIGDRTWPHNYLSDMRQLLSMAPEEVLRLTYHDREMGAWIVTHAAAAPMKFQQQIDLAILIDRDTDGPTVKEVLKNNKRALELAGAAATFNAAAGAAGSIGASVASGNVLAALAKIAALAIPQVVGQIDKIAKASNPNLHVESNSEGTSPNPQPVASANSEQPGMPWWVYALIGYAILKG